MGTRLLTFGGVFLASVVSLASYQSAAPGKLYTYYMPPGGSAWLWQSVVIDSPLVLSVDSTGQAHLTSTRRYRVAASFNGTSWSLPQAPRAGSLECYLNGLAETGLTLAGSTITFTFPTLSSDVVACSYDPI
jgi:hypothetical protein